MIHSGRPGTLVLVYSIGVPSSEIKYNETETELHSYKQMIKKQHTEEHT